MKIDIIKKNFDQNPEVGDVFTLGNVVDHTTFLLIYIDHLDYYGAVDLTTGKIHYTENSDLNGLNRLISTIMNNTVWTEYALIKSKDVKMSVDCNNAFIMQNKGDF